MQFPRSGERRAFLTKRALLTESISGMTSYKYLAHSHGAETRPETPDVTLRRYLNKSDIDRACGVLSVFSTYKIARYVRGHAGGPADNLHLSCEVGKRKGFPGCRNPSLEEAGHLDKGFGNKATELKGGRKKSAGLTGERSSANLERSGEHGE